MTKDEVAQMIAYCDENKISYKQSCRDLGLIDTKRKYSSKEDGENNRKALRELLPDRWAKQTN